MFDLWPEKSDICIHFRNLLYGSVFLLNHYKSLIEDICYFSFFKSLEGIEKKLD